jgi:acyl CoA:acetate/3-ketoacid CoA transferase beta subunit
MRGRVKAFRAPKCAYPLTAVRCVSRVYTYHGVVSREKRSGTISPDS